MIQRTAPDPDGPRVVVLGGYGVFGSRLARLLLRDGCAVWIAGRRLADATRMAGAIGGAPLGLDRDGDLTPLIAVRPQVVVDAAGPFRRSGADPYALARFCIAHGIDYLDLSDDAGFTAGIATLDAEARAAGRFAISGVSSVPGLSAAVVAALATGMQAIDCIETAILPGNRAPRGRSVVASILDQAGRTVTFRRGGVARQVRSWSDPRRYRLAPGIVRTGYLIEVPDAALFPARFAARSVVFRAGMELGLLNRALVLFAVLRSRGLLPCEPARLVGPGRWFAGLLEPLGSDRGGMIASVTGRSDGLPLRRRWVLLAEAGEGPFVPAVAARALIRRRAAIRPGARPCLDELSLAEAEAAMADLAIGFRREEEPAPTLFQAALGPAWPALAPELRAAHSVRDFESFGGRADVERGRGWFAGLVAGLFGLPSSGRDVPVRVTMTRVGDAEIWERDFAGRRFRSTLTASPEPGRCRERFGPFTFEIALSPAAGALRFATARGRFLGLPLPRATLPRSTSMEFAAAGRFRFDVALDAPFGLGRVIRYFGWLEPDADAEELVASARKLA